MKPKYIIIITTIAILISVITFLTINFINKRIPLFKISHTSNVISPWGWDIVSFNRDQGLFSYYFIKQDHDTTINFSFNYFKSKKNIYNKKGLEEYDLIKEYQLNDSLINISLTIYGDSLYINKRHITKTFFSVKDGNIIKGKYYYYYYYKMEKHELDSCQINYFKQHKDSLIKVGANYIPIFNEQCEIIK